MLLEQLQNFIPPEGIKIITALFLSFVVGLGREGERSSTGIYYFGGIRTFPLLGLLGYSLIYISPDSIIPFVIGLVVVGLLMGLSYFRKFAQGVPGFTTELAGLMVFLVGGIVSMGYFWVATTLIVIEVFLLEMKPTLAKFGRKVSRKEMITLTKFLLVFLVILPIAPNKNFTQFELNPFKTWLVVVAITGISYFSYIVQKITKSSKSVILSAALGGIYSSTMTTVVLARKSKNNNNHYLFSGSLLVSSSVMYLRVLALIFLFNRTMAGRLLIGFSVIGVLGLIIGFIIAMRHHHDEEKISGDLGITNPLELKIALLFAFLFIITVIITKLLAEYMGNKGVYGLSALMGLTEIDPFILGITQSAGISVNVSVAVSAVIIATSCNNLAKALYAWLFSRNKSGLWGALMLIGLGLIGALLLFAV